MRGSSIPYRLAPVCYFLFLSFLAQHAWNEANDCVDHDQGRHLTAMEDEITGGDIIRLKLIANAPVKTSKPEKTSGNNANTSNRIVISTCPSPSQANNCVPKGAWYVSLA